jgi:O-acetylhomoserine (thiol)-lyase
MAPQTAFYLLQGLETLPLRIARHVERAGSLPSRPIRRRTHRLAGARPPRPCAGAGLLPGGLDFGFDIKGGREASRRFIERLKCSPISPTGDAKSLVIHRWRRTPG